MSLETEAREEVRDVPQDPLSALLLPLGRPFAVAFLLIVAFSFYEVVMRYVFDAPTIWVHETTTALTALCFAFGGAYCLGTDRHIRVVLLYDHVSPRVRRILDVVISLVGAAACAMMAWAAWSLAYKAFYTPGGQFRLETSGSAWNPPTPAIVKSVLFVVLCLMCLQFLLQALRHARRDAGVDAHHGPVGEGRFDDA
ncbi:TRAP transporter small permease subunit [Mangrovibrevibacter kandeliae]|uniref:TRAP transporter small permease subunit n=1 Tax=Mangrovibrevibacter kandeliae TaxID=2968473 RepID=UPI0021190D84|nr:MULTISPECIES: TRAP transporter small permease [unclassified Aurantimonas]MCQ8782395.1 TRAP transporter small permease [Aurantimonas sp. CSK15Z-1]MCW4117086.1 TRAP transporter small permease [Aurantimonas sp. MSK8Z-1]